MRGWLAVPGRKGRHMAETPRRSSQSRSWSRALRKDVPAGLINAVVSVPDGLSSAALTGVNPVYGLYTSIMAPMSGSLLVSSQLMQIATTRDQVLGAHRSEARQARCLSISGRRGAALPGRCLPLLLPPPVSSNLMCRSAHWIRKPNRLLPPATTSVRSRR